MAIQCNLETMLLNIEKSHIWASRLAVEKSQTYKTKNNSKPKESIYDKVFSIIKNKLSNKDSKLFEEFYKENRWLFKLYDISYVNDKKQQVYYKKDNIKLQLNNKKDLLKFYVSNNDTIKQCANFNNAVQIFLQEVL